jgi:hypothetical protein
VLVVLVLRRGRGRGDRGGVTGVETVRRLRLSPSYGMRWMKRSTAFDGSRAKTGARLRRIAGNVESRSEV